MESKLLRKGRGLIFEIALNMVKIDGNGQLTDLYTFK